jgi:gliding motility-associated-like protein
MKKLTLLILSLISPLVFFAQNDCMSNPITVVNPQPVGGGYAPGTVVQYCVTYNNWNTGFNTNWCEGFDITIGPGWVANSITPVTYPNDNSGVGQWVWIPGTFNGNPLSSGGAGNNFGPGFFYDYNSNGQSVDDWGDNSTGPWTFCFNITVGAIPGTSLSLQVSAVSDGYAGSWGSPGCNGVNQDQLSPGTTVLGCLTPPVISLQSTQDASCNGAADGELSISVAGGAAPFNYTLNGNPGAIFGGGAFYTNLTAGNYVIVCEDGDGCASNTLNVVVNENSVVLNNTAALQDVLCFGESTGSFNIDSQDGAQPYTYTLGAQVNQTGQFSNLPAGNYIVQVTDANGCSNFHNVSINEIPEMTPQIVSVTDANCFGSSDGDCEISCVGGTVANSTGIFTDIFQSANHIIVITDDNGCQSQQNIIVSEPTQIGIFQPLVSDIDCFGNTNGEITIFANGGLAPYEYQLGPNTTLNGFFSGLGVGNYQILVEDDNGCQFLTPLITVNGPQLPLTSQLITTQPTCHSGSDGEIDINISGGTAPYSIVWNTVPIQNTSPAINLSSGNYSVDITDVNGCTHQNQVTLFQPNDIFVTTTNLTTICFGEDVELNSNQQNAIPPFSIQWTNNQNGNLNLNGDIVTPPSNTTYTATLTDANGCQGSATQVVVVNPLPDPSFSESSTTGCERHCIDFNINNPNPNYTYLWTFGDASISFNGDQLEHCYNESGVYTVFVQATTNLGCVDSLRKLNQVIINKTPTAEFIISPKEITFIDEPDFEFQNISEDATNYFWNLGDSTLTQVENPKHRYESPGDFCVKLISVANYNTGISTCIDSIEKCIKILPLSVCYVPSSFTPNDDNYNDVFFAKGSLISEFEISIFNRWGQQIYRSYDIDNGWDGNFGQSQAPAGIYLYIVKYRDIDHRPYSVEGTVLLLR